MWLNSWLSPHPLHSDSQWILQPPHRVQAVVAHQHLEEPQRVALYPAPHPALLSLPLLLAVFKTCLPLFLIQKPARSLQIHSERELPNRIRGRGSGNFNRRQCLHLNQWSPVVAASIGLVIQTWHILCLQRADFWSSTWETVSRLWVQASLRQ